MVNHGNFTISFIYSERRCNPETLKPGTQRTSKRFVLKATARSDLPLRVFLRLKHSHEIHVEYLKQILSENNKFKELYLRSPRW